MMQAFMAVHASGQVLRERGLCAMYVCLAVALGLVPSVFRVQGACCPWSQL